MRLPGTEKWDIGLVSEELAFEGAFAEAADQLGNLMDAADRDGIASPEAGQRITEADYAIGRAAEFAFAMGNAERGLRICKEVQRHSRPRTDFQWAFASTLGAIARVQRVWLQPRGATIDSNGPDARMEVRWVEDDSSYAAALIRAFIPAAAASNHVLEAMTGLFSGSDHLKPQVLTALLGSDECRALLAPYFVREFHAGNEELIFRERSVAVAAMEDRYSRHLSLMQSDTYHWSKMQPKGALIDWPLLSLWVGVMRSQRSGLPMIEPSPPTEAADFTRWLAREIVNATG